MNINEFLPFLIPLVIVQLCLQIYSVIHILKHPNYKCGNKVIWLIVVCLFQYFGVIAYFILGKGE